MNMPTKTPPDVILRRRFIWIGSQIADGLARCLVVGEGGGYGFFPLSCANPPMLHFCLVRPAFGGILQLIPGMSFKAMFGKRLGFSVTQLIDHVHGNLLSLIKR
jgi:hypothetical protein